MTPHTSIVRVITIVHVGWQSRANWEAGLIPCTLYIIQYNWTKASSKVWCINIWRNKSFPFIKVRIIQTYVHWVGSPNCLHTTLASLLSQPLSHTVPHSPFWHISTLPSFGLAPPTNWTVSSSMHVESGFIIIIFYVKRNLISVSAYHDTSHQHLQSGHNCAVTEQDNLRAFPHSLYTVHYPVQWIQSLLKNFLMHTHLPKIYIDIAILIVCKKS